MLRVDVSGLIWGCKIPAELKVGGEEPVHLMWEQVGVLQTVFCSVRNGCVWVSIGLSIRLKDLLGPVMRVTKKIKRVSLGITSP